MTRILAALLVGLALGARPAAAQDSLIRHPTCLKAAPAPRCSSILLTNFGIDALAGGGQPGGLGFRVLADWGLLVNTGRRVSVGGSWLLSADRDGLFTGPMVRVRLWQNDSSSWEVGLGHAVTQHNDNTLETFGLIKWSPIPSFGLSLRPEWRRHVSYDCDVAPPFQCTSLPRGRFAMSAGVELGGVAGLVGSFTSALAGVVLLFAYLSSDD